MLKYKMPFLGHLSELRKHLWRIVIVITIISVYIFINIKIFMDYIFLAPSKNNFITFKFLNFISKIFGFKEQIFMPNQFPIQIRKMFEQVNVAISISIIGGFIIGFPYLIFEIWKFITPGLTTREKKIFLLFFVNLNLFFLLGIIFGYFIIFPLSIYFGYFFSISNQKNIIINIDLSNYIDTIISICLSMGILFLLPIIFQFFTYIGLINPNILKMYRKHAVIIILIICALITPPDAISMFIAACPLFLLYELSIYFSIHSYNNYNSN